MKKLFMLLLFPLLFNAQKVIDGDTFDYKGKRYCQNYKYFRAEKFAKTNKLGIHNYYFINPQEYRKQNNYGKQNLLTKTS